MQINLQHDLDRLAAQLKGSAKQARFAVALGLTRTAVAVKDAELAELKRSIDRPTPYTLKSLYLTKATPAKLEAKVWLKDDLAGSGTPATKYLLPQIEGGARSVKRFEKALQLAGHMPAGYQCVPARGAILDSYGNPSRGQIIQILSQLRITLTAGYTRNMSFDARKQIAAQRRAGGRYFVIKTSKGGKSPGVYQREFMGRNVTAVYLFKRATSYRQRFDFWGVGRATVERELQGAMAQAMAETMSTANTVVQGESL